MSTDLDARAVDAHALRLAFGAPLAYALALWHGAPGPFIAPIACLSLASAMRTPPPMKALVGVLAAIWLAPWLLSGFSAVLVEYPYMLLGFVGLLLFHGMRLQARAESRAAGGLLVTFGIMAPLVTDASEQAGALLNDVLLYNVSFSLLAVLLGFVAFPHPPGGLKTTGAPVAPDAADATLHGLVGALAMLPLMALFLTLDILSAMRVLFVASAVAAATGEGELRRQRAIAFLGLAVGAGIAILVSLLSSVWQAPSYVVLLMLIGALTLCRKAVHGPQGPLYVSGMVASWALLTTGPEPLLKIAHFSLYAALGVGWAVGARAMLMMAIERFGRKSPLPA